MSVAATGIGPAATSIGALDWETDVPVATHPLMLVNFAKVIAISVGLMGGLLVLLMVVQGETAAIGPLMVVLAAVAAGLFLFILLIALLFFGNRMPMRFSVGPDGASASVTDRRAEAASGAAIIVGLLAGKPAVAGSGLIGTGGSNQTVRWNSIARARFHPRMRAISLVNSWRTVLILFCQNDNYEAVAAIVRSALDARPPAERASKSPLGHLLLRSALVVTATVPLFRLPDNLEVGPFAPIVILCFALAAVWLVPLLAWVVIAMLGYIAAATLLNGVALMLSLFGEGLASPILSGNDWAMLAAAGLGAAYLIWLSVATLHGRIQSALMSR